MKRTVIALLVLLSLATSAVAADTFSAGLRAGAAAGQSSIFTEVFGDLHLNAIVSVGVTLAYTVVDHKFATSVKRDEALPVSALLKLRAPLPILKPYVGVGEAVVFHDKRGIKGTAIAVAGAELSVLPLVFLSAEYRRQFDDKLDFISGGVGVRF